MADKKNSTEIFEDFTNALEHEKNFKKCVEIVNGLDDPAKEKLFEMVSGYLDQYVKDKMK